MKNVCLYSIDVYVDLDAGILQKEVLEKFLKTIANKWIFHVKDCIIHIFQISLAVYIIFPAYGYGIAKLSVILRLHIILV